MGPKVAAFDLDGTLTNSQKIITPSTLEALRMLQENRVQIVLASGRPYYGIRPLALQLGLNQTGGFVLCFNGGKIINCKTEEVLYSNTLSVAHAHRVFDLAREYNVTVLTYSDDKIITEYADDPYVQIEGNINKMQIQQVSSLTDTVSDPVNKALIVGDHEKLKKLMPILQEQLSQTADIYFSAPYFLEVVPKGIDKAASLAFLLRLIDLTSSDLIAFGDGMNDASMIQYAKIGVAMGNAAPGVLKIADYITDSNDEDGVASALWHFYR